MAEKEYIEREAVLEIVKRTSGDYAAAWSAIRQLPAADVAPVVRCKDCKHAAFYSCKNDKCYRGIICEYQIGTDDENFFCAYGEREEK